MSKKRLDLKKKQKSIIAEFKEFALRGNVIDLAVGVIIGAAFQGIINSLVKDLIMPLIGTVTGGVDFSNKFLILGEVPEGTVITTLEEARKVTSVFAYGSFVTAVINFIIMAFAIFILVKVINTLSNLRIRNKDGKEEIPVEKQCSFCKKKIAYEATRCPFCTSVLEVENK